MTRQWTIVRLVLGQAQFAGASATLYFVITTGESPYTVWSALVTALVSGVSIYLFKIRKRC
jgi:uncharacterized membrane protein YdbT with pleckstrin-like domain